MKIRLAVFTLTLSLLAACGSGAKKNPETAALNAQEEVQSASFTVEKNVNVAAVEAADAESGAGPGSAPDSAPGFVSAAVKTLSLPKGTELTVLETKFDAEKGELLHLGIDSDDESLPSDLWVKATPELKAALASQSMPESLDDEEGFVSAAGKRMTYCYRYVKQYLLKTGKVKVYLPGVSAWMAYNELPKHGFRLTGHSPSTAQNGEVCVYKGGRQGHGHIEVKINGKWWYGYGYINHPMQGRIFMGCFNK